MDVATVAVNENHYDDPSSPQYTIATSGHVLTHTGETKSITVLHHDDESIAITSSSSSSCQSDKANTNTTTTTEPMNIEQFITYHNHHLTLLREELDYVRKCFTITYQYKNILEHVVDEYFAMDQHFKYRNTLHTLDTELILLINRDENRYQRLIDNINTDLVLMNDDQFDFASTTTATTTFDTDGTFQNFSNNNNTTATTNMFLPMLPGQCQASQPKCPACGYRSRTRIQLESHLLEHNDNPLVVCCIDDDDNDDGDGGNGDDHDRDRCQLTFPLHTLATHEKYYHPKSHLICELCNAQFESKSILIQHYKLHLQRKEKFHCDFPNCNYTDLYQSRIDRHKQTIHGISTSSTTTTTNRQQQQKYRCKSCNGSYPNRTTLLSHRFTVHHDRSLLNKYHKCTNVDVCDDDVFSCRPNLTQHKNIDDKGDGDCDGGTNGQQQHQEHHKSSNIIYFNVNENDQMVPVSNVAKDKVKSDDDDNLTKTSTISKKRKKKPTILRSSKKVKDHNSSIVDNDDKVDDGVVGGGGAVGDNVKTMLMLDQYKITECEMCKIPLPNTAAMLEHLRVRHHQYTAQVYHCNTCTYRTLFRSMLNSHLNTIHGGQYQCEICGRLNKDFSNHNRHLLIHKQLRYRCRHVNCDAVYKSRRAFTVHVLTHSNDQPVYRCDWPECSYVSNYANALNVHMLTHSNVRKFTCTYDDQCGKSFKRNGDLNKHVKHAHLGVQRPIRSARRNKQTTIIV